MNNTEIQRLVSSTQNYTNKNYKKCRRFRSSFTTDQLIYLEKEFKKFPYIGNVNRQELARTLNLSERAIKIWFQNRRMKEKKDANREADIVEDRSNSDSLNPTNNQLNNVNNLLSTNDQFSTRTPLLFNNEVKYVDIPIEIKNNNTGNNLVNYVALQGSREQEITTTTETFENRSAIAKSSICEVRQIEMRKSPVATPFKNEDNITNEAGRTQTIQCCSMSQDLPEDLSQHCKTAIKPIFDLNPADSSRNARCLPVYIPNCYALSYPSGNVLWNPTSMAQIIPGRATLPTRYHPGPHAVLNHQSLRKTNCNCDCHQQFVPQPIPDQSQGQYIPVFTVPYTTAHI